MKTHIFAYSDKGCILTQKISNLYNDARCYSIKKYADKYNFTEITKISDIMADIFSSADLIIFVCATGIAVRSIAPFVKHKTTDPAVISIDDNAKFVISLLSGHIGGANEITEFLAERLGAIPVITTSTDINNRFSVDTFAQKNNIYISSMKLAKEVSANILNRDIIVQNDFNFDYGRLKNLGVLEVDTKKSDVYITYKNITCDNTLLLVPKCLSVGIGCRKNIDLSFVEKALDKVFNENKLNKMAIKNFASIDIKREEQALLCISNKYNVPIEFFSADMLNSVEGAFTKSNFVKGITGTNNVCERSAKLISNGRIIVKKQAINGVTVAVALNDIDFIY